MNGGLDYFGTSPDMPRTRGKAAGTIELVDAASRILEASRWPMTLRQLYYQVVSAADRGELGFPKTEQSYKRLARTMRDAREDGTVPWHWIVDNVRTVFKPRTFDGVEGLLESSSRFYRADLMRSQPVAIQVWAESDSIAAVIKHATDPYCVPVFPAHGYSGRRFLWDAANDAVDAYFAGKEVHILHVGDHDPSGDDIFRDVVETIRLYAYALANEMSAKAAKQLPPFLVEEWADWLKVKRLALTPEQVQAWDLPHRPIKAKDARAAGFAGVGAVEVEALPADQLLGIVENAVLSRIDERALEAAELAERSEREVMRRIAGTPVERLLQVAS